MQLPVPILGEVQQRRIELFRLWILASRGKRRITLAIGHFGDFPVFDPRRAVPGMDDVLGGIDADIAEHNNFPIRALG